MRRQSKYSPHLMTISETSTIAVSAKERPAPKEDAPVATPPSPSPLPEPSEQHEDAAAATLRRVERSQSAPPDVDREPSTPAAPRSRSTTDVRESAGRSSGSNKYGRSALHNAVRKGDKRAIARLVQEQPALVRTPDARGNLPLHYAANPQVPHHADVAYALLRAGSPVNALNARGQSPLVVFVISTEEDADLVPRMLLHFHARPAVRVTDELMLAPYAAARGLRKVAAAIREYL